MPLTLQATGSTTLPIDAEILRPDTLAELSVDEIRRWKLSVGNQTAEIGELFRVEGNANDRHVQLEGELANLQGVGRRMSGGRLTVRGTAGAFLGAEMSGGTLEVVGDVGDWAGAAMRGGTMHIRGNAGHALGAALPGARLGMRDGLILLEGNAGDDAGLAMRRGLIAIAGSAGMGLGRAMVAGSVFVFGPVARGAGGGMKRGTLALFDERPVPLLPTFRPANRARPPFVTLYLRALRDRDFPVPESAYAGMFERYNGDLLETGKGEILHKATRV